MNKFTLQLMSASSLAILLSGCSLFLTDHSDDYQDGTPKATTLVVIRRVCTVKRCVSDSE